MSEESEAGRLLRSAKNLVETMDKMADKNLPEEITEIVKLHAKLAVGSAFIPLPGIDVAASATSIWTMYLRINSKLGISLNENILKTIATGICTNLVSYVAMVGVGEALKFIPFIGSISGTLVMSASLYAVTLTSGYIYLKALTLISLKNKNVVNEEELSKIIDNVLKDDKEEIKEFLEESKNIYKSKNR